MDQDRLCSFFWLAVSIIVCVESRRAGIGSFRSPGPGFFPFWGGVALGSFAIIMIFTTLKKKGKGKIIDLWEGTKWYKVIIVIISLLIYDTLLPTLGYLITTFGLMTILFSIIGRMRLWIKIVSALVTVLITYVIFVLLGVQLPKGIVGL